jgi:WXG100 family type VII secretion target
MADDFSVTAIELRLCGSMVGQLAAEARTAVVDVEADVRTLLSAGWSGRAADGFAEGWRRWQAGAGDVVEALDAMGALLDTTGQAYAAVDERAASTVTAPGQALR